MAAAAYVFLQFGLRALALLLESAPQSCNAISAFTALTTTN